MTWVAHLFFLCVNIMSMRADDYFVRADDYFVRADDIQSLST